LRESIVNDLRTACVAARAAETPSNQVDGQLIGARIVSKTVEACAMALIRVWLAQ
jgi:hypothetical protein